MEAVSNITQPAPVLLVVDDDREVRLTTVMILERAGYTVLQGASAADALTIAREHRPDLVLLDVMLPDGDGREVSRQLKTDPELAGIFVVLLSGLKISPADQASGLTEALADGYILRPVSAPVLRGWVESFLRLRAAQDQAEHYRQLFEAESDAVFLIDNETGQILEANRAATLLYGYSLAELLTKKNTDLSAEAAETRRVTQESPVRADQIVTIPLRFHRKKDGQVFPVEITGRFFSWRGRSVHLVAIRDITSRRQMEESLRQSEERLDFALKATNDGLWDWNLTNNRAYFSPQYYLMLGYQPDEFAANYDNWRRLIHPDDLPRCETVIQASLAAGHGYETEFRMRAKNGEWKWILGRGRVMAVDDRNVPVRMVGTHVDITDRKQAEAALRENEERFRLLFERLPLGYQSLDAEGRFIEVNQAWLDTLGYEREEVIGHWFGEFVTPPYVEAFRQRFPQFKETGEVHNEFEMRHKDGSIIHVAFDGKIGYDREHHFKQTHCILRDITERKLAEAEREKMEAQTRQIQKAESLSRMAGAIAHHFNNQLAAVMGYLELTMLHISPSPEELTRNLTQAMAAAHRAAEVSSLMLTYLGQTPDRTESLDLSEVCAKSMSIIQAAMPKNVTLQTDWPAPGPIISANAGRLQQLLTNLVTNSWEAMNDRPGQIDLRIKTVAPVDISPANRFPLDWQPQHPTYACLEVTDTGSGIAGPDIEKLFDPFFSTKFTGRGLGLAAVLGIVRSISGVVTVESQPGRGSVFRLFFPVLEQAVSPPPHKSALLPPANGGLVLLVEDEEMVRQMAAKMLDRLGFSVLTARDGVEAVDMFRQHQAEIRCVLCDLTMPRMDGWETLAALRQLSPDLPVVLASGYDEAYVMANPHPEYPQAFLGKPYQLKSMSAAIIQALTKDR
jgi:PAS domain S-box-containing protein